MRLIHLLIVFPVVHGLNMNKIYEQDDPLESGKQVSALALGGGGCHSMLAQQGYARGFRFAINSGAKHKSPDFTTTSSGGSWLYAAMLAFKVIKKGNVEALYGMGEEGWLSTVVKMNLDRDAWGIAMDFSGSMQGSQEVRSMMNVLASDTNILSDDGTLNIKSADGMALINTFRSELPFLEDVTDGDLLSLCQLFGWSQEKRMAFGDKINEIYLAPTIERWNILMCHNSSMCQFDDTLDFLLSEQDEKDGLFTKSGGLFSESGMLGKVRPKFGAVDITGAYEKKNNFKAAQDSQSSFLDLPFPSSLEEEEFFPPDMLSGIGGWQEAAKQITPAVAALTNVIMKIDLKEILISLKAAQDCCDAGKIQNAA